MRLLGKKRKVEGSLHDATQGTRGARAELGHPFISDVTVPRRSVPPAILVSPGFVLGSKISFDLDLIAVTACVNQGEETGNDQRDTNRYRSYFATFALVVTIL